MNSRISPIHSLRSNGRRRARCTADVGAGGTACDHRRVHTVIRRRMVRSEDRLVAGVSGTLATALHVPRLLVRVALVVLATANGFGLFFYLLCWALMPDEARPTDL